MPRDQDVDRLFYLFGGKKYQDLEVDISTILNQVKGRTSLMRPERSLSERTCRPRWSTFLYTMLTSCSCNIDCIIYLTNDSDAHLFLNFYHYN